MNCIQYKGRQYRKLKSDERIEVGAIHSFDNETPYPILHPETVGQTPDNFSPRRTFYNPCITPEYLLQESLLVVEDYIHQVGKCDHAANICICYEMDLAHKLKWMIKNYENLKTPHQCRRSMCENDQFMTAEQICFPYSAAKLQEIAEREGWDD